MAPPEQTPRRGNNNTSDNNNNSQVDTEPFPSIQVSSDDGATTTTTTTVGPTITTTTTYPSRGGRPYTITSSSPSSLAPSPTPASPTIVGPNITPVPSDSNLAETATSPAPALYSRPTVNRIRPIGIRRLPSSNLPRLATDGSNGDVSESAGQSSGRGRSSSAPQHYLAGASGTANNLTKQTTRNSTLAPVVEHPTADDPTADRDTLTVPTNKPSRRRSVSNAARSVMSRFSDHSRERDEPEYDDQVVDLLDVIGKSLPFFSILTVRG